MNKGILLAIFMIAFGFNGHAREISKKILVFTKTTRYYHESIPAGIAAIIQLGKANGFEVDTTTKGETFTSKNLRRYAAVIFLSTSGNLLDSLQKASFIQYIRSGGGYMGIHSASASEKEWAWYGRLVGAVFTDHPEAQTGDVIVVDSLHPATRHLPARWKRMDEWYNFKEVPTGVHVLLCADESTYQGGKNGSYHPLAWYHEYDGGRAFYTAIGHFTDSWADPFYLKHILAGINYAMGKTATQ